MLPCSDCAYEAHCLKWATHFCLDYKPKSLPPPPIALATCHSARDHSATEARKPFRITLFHISPLPIRQRA
jgi:hypothetical protein